MSELQLLFTGRDKAQFKMAFQVVLDYLYRLLPNTLAITSSIFFTVLIILGTALYRRYKVKI